MTKEEAVLKVLRWAFDAGANPSDVRRVLVALLGEEMMLSMWERVMTFLGELQKGERQ